jgi:hypothetical protein
VEEEDESLSMSMEEEEVTALEGPLVEGFPRFFLLAAVEEDATVDVLPVTGVSSSENSFSGPCLDDSMIPRP